jgi:protein arginine kinase activator
MIDGRASTWNLCEECARSRGVSGSLPTLAGPLVDILMGLLEEAGEGSESGRASEEPVCPRCGLTYGEFRRAGRLGCAECYRAFRAELVPLLRRIHGATGHRGRLPEARSRSIESERELERLRAQLSKAVEREEYERAAELRDLIRAKESTLGERARNDVDV